MPFFRIVHRTKVALAAFVATTLIASTIVNSAEVAFDESRLATINTRMKELVARHQIAGAVTAVATERRTVHLGTVGKADIKSGRGMITDSIFRIASMTKPITATGLMILHSEGKLSINDPIEKFIPAFKGKSLKMADQLQRSRFETC